jgi:hypothetical protein
MRQEGCGPHLVGSIAHGWMLAKAGPARQGQQGRASKAGQCSSFGGRLSATSPARSNLLLDASAEGSQGGSAGRQVDQQRSARESRVQARAHALGCSTQRTLRLKRAYGKALTLQQLATHPLCTAIDASHNGGLGNGEGQERQASGRGFIKMQTQGKEGGGLLKRVGRVAGACQALPELPIVAAAAAAVAGGGAVHVARCGLHLGLPATQAGLRAQR